MTAYSLGVVDVLDLPELKVCHGSMRSERAGRQLCQIEKAPRVEDLGEATE